MQKDKSIKKNNILLTGGSGFIGILLLKKILKDESCNVYLIDPKPYKNLEKGLKQRVKHIQSKIEDIPINKLDSIISSCSKIYFLSALKFEKHTRDNKKLLDSNIISLERILAGLKPFHTLVFTSSLYVYGIFNKNKIKEKQKTDPLNLYGLTKIFGEQLIQFYSKRISFKFQIFRLFFVYDERLISPKSYKTLIPKFKYLSKNNLPLSINGDGKQKLDYINSYDVIHYLVLGMNNPLNRILNLGSSYSTSINDLCKIFDKNKNKRHKKVFIKKDFTHNSFRVANNKLLIQLYGAYKFKKLNSIFDDKL